MKAFPKPVTAREEREYLERYKEGDEEARSTLIERNMRLVAQYLQYGPGGGAQLFNQQYQNYEDIPNVPDRLRWCRHHMGRMR